MLQCLTIRAFGHLNIHLNNSKQLFYSSLIQDNPGEPVLSQWRDLLEQPLDFYKPDVLPATQPIVSKHYSGLVVFCLTDTVSTNTWYCLTNSVKALKEAKHTRENVIKRKTNGICKLCWLLSLGRRK